MISLSQVLNEASSAGKLLFAFERMITAINYCPFVGHDRAMPILCEIVVTKLAKDIKQHRLPRNIEDLQVSRTTIVSICPASSDECYEGFIQVSTVPSSKELPLALVYFTATTFYKTTLDKEFCTGLFALCTRLLSAKNQDSDSYSTEVYNAVFALLDEEKGAATAASRALCDVIKTRVFLFLAPSRE